YRPIDADRKQLVGRGQVRISPVMQDERAITSQSSGDRLSRLWMIADVARKRQELEGALQVDHVGIDAIRDRRALGLLVLARCVPKLKIWAEPADLQGHGETRVGIVAQNLAVGCHGLSVGAVAGGGQLARVAA